MKYSNDIVCDLLEYIDKNINSQISIHQLSIKFLYDKYYLMKLFKKEIGVSIILFVNYIRIYNSILQIKNTNYSITRIALLNGFSSLEYFSEVFHQVMGVSPKNFKFYHQNRYLKDSIKEEKLLENWIILQDFYDNILKYKKNRKPVKAPIIKRSIFL